MSPMSQLISEGENGDGDEYEEETTVDAKKYIVFRAQHNFNLCCDDWCVSFFGDSCNSNKKVAKDSNMPHHKLV